MTTRNAGVLQCKFPQLYSFPLNKNISAKVFMDGDIQRHFWRPVNGKLYPASGAQKSVAPIT
jgi:hypothetical protein